MEGLYEKYCSCGYRVTTDSRAVAGGEIFFALKGENFDGNAYAMKALEMGAAYAVVDDPSLPDDPRLVKVEDSYSALRQLAICHREHLTIPVIGRTGTNGKTTTKELITTVLSCRYKVAATKGNLNNDIGVPLTVLSITPDAQIAVIEMGANHPDDIEKLVRISQPEYGLITNVGKAHLLGFGSFEGVKAAKGALYRWLGSHRGSRIFLNEDDADLREMSLKEPCHVFGYGLKHQGAEILPVTADEPFLRVSIPESDGAPAVVVSTHLVGAYNATNVLAAIAVGAFFGVSRVDAANAIGAYEPTNNRSQMMRTATNMLIVDAYNANPSSMSAALDNFAAVVADKKVALLGDMRELGEDSVKEHVRIVEKLRNLGLDACLVGAEFKKALDETGAAFRWFADSASLAESLSSEPVSGYAVLVKGSRGIQMEKVIPSLQKA